MAIDSRLVLDQLVRSGIWSSPNNILKFKKVVLDVDSIVTYLYHYCNSKHVRRLKSLPGGSEQLDYYSTTIVNYVEFSQYVNQLLDFFAHHTIEVALVYRGKYMEAPIFGLLPAQFKKNTQRVSESLLLLINYDKLDAKAIEEQQKHKKPSRQNLALNIFKLIVNAKRQSNAKIQAHQAFYSPYPTLAKLARDLQCPVLTNNGDFIIMDVRAGFVLFNEFWQTYFETINVVSKYQSTSSLASQSNSSKSPIGLSISRSLFSPKNNYTIRFNYNRSFLRQHPGLNAPLALQLFPQTSSEFIAIHSKSLLRLKIYDREFSEKELMLPIVTGKQNQSMHYHWAAARLEQVLMFLCGKNADLLGNLIRSEATRINSTFDEDYRSLFNYYAVAYEFKSRLKFILKYINDATQINHVEWCLLNRECSADYLLSLLSCAIGHLASVSYNKTLQFEDLNTKKSAYSMLDHSKCLLMSLFSDNKSHKCEPSISLSSKQRENISTRYSLASLTIIDRENSKLIERSLTTTYDDAQLDAIRGKLTLGNIARRNVAKQDLIKLINMAFKSNDLTKMSPKLEAHVGPLLGGNDEQFIKSELAIVLSLHKYCFEIASSDDEYFKKAYRKISHHFEVAVLNHYLYIKQVKSRVKVSKELVQLVNLILKQDFENVINPMRESNQPSRQSRSPKDATKREGLRKSSISPVASKTSSINGRSSCNKTARKQIRHLVELLNSSLEAYCELNAFLNYPMPKLNLHLHYNPILLCNLAFHSYAYPNDKSLIWC